jgi:biopolymer transport protein ExbB/TolQ
MSSKAKGILSVGFLVPNVILVIIVALGVEAYYSHVVRPAADQMLIERQFMLDQESSSHSTKEESRPLFLIIKDKCPQWEIVFCLWGFLFLCYKFVQVSGERRTLKLDLIGLAPGERIIPENAGERFTALKAYVDANPKLRDRILPKCLLAALHRFHASNSIQDAAAAARDSAERYGDDLDSSLSLVRYIAWAIPAIGFVGTVSGIGEAMSKAEAAIKGNLSEVTNGLGLAFNSTFVGLILCIFLMYVLHAAQSSQESLILQMENYCEDKLIDAMRVPANPENRSKYPWETDPHSSA